MGYGDITERIKELIDHDESCCSESDQDTTPTLASTGASAAIHAAENTKETKATKKSPVATATAATITAADAVKKTTATTKKSVNAVTKAVVQTTKGQKMAATSTVKKAPAKKSIPQHQRPAKKRKLRNS